MTLLLAQYERVETIALLTPILEPVFGYMVFLATFRLFGHLDNIFLILNFGVMVISAKWSILPGQYRGPYIRN